MAKRKAQTSAKPRSATKTRSKVKRAKPIASQHPCQVEAGCGAGAAEPAAGRHHRGDYRRRPAGSPIRCAAFWPAWCARSSG